MHRQVRGGQVAEIRLAEGVYASAVNSITERRLVAAIRIGVSAAEEDLRAHLDELRENVRPHIRHAHVQRELYKVAESDPKMSTWFQANAAGNERHLVIQSDALLYTVSWEPRVPHRMKPGVFREENARDYQLPLEGELGEDVRRHFEAKKNDRVYGILVYGVADQDKSCLSFVQMVFPRAGTGEIYDRIDIGIRHLNLLTESTLVEATPPEIIADHLPLKTRQRAEQKHE